MGIIVISMEMNINKENKDNHSQKKEQFAVLTKYINELAEAEVFGEWVVDRKNDGSPEHPIQFPFVNFSRVSEAFVEDFYKFSESHLEYELQQYGDILERNGLKWDNALMRRADVENLDEQVILALIMGAIRAERFCDGALLGFFEDGYILKWLKRLKEIDTK